MNLGLYMLELFQSEVTEAQLSQTYTGGRGKESSPEAYRIPGETLGGGGLQQTHSWSREAWSPPPAHAPKFRGDLSRLGPVSGLGISEGGGRLGLSTV